MRDGEQKKHYYFIAMVNKTPFSNTGKPIMALNAFQETPPNLQLSTDAQLLIGVENSYDLPSRNPSPLFRLLAIIPRSLQHQAIR
jgi:hypothetical protein